MSYSLKNNLTQGPVGPLLVRMTLPMIWGLLALISLQLADMYFISLMGTKPLVAIGYTFPVTMIVLSFSVALGITTSSLVSRKIGEGDLDQAGCLATHAMIIAASLGCIIAFLGIFTVRPLFTSMGASGDVFTGIADFMVTYYAGCIFLTVLMTGNAALRATGDTFSPAMILIGCAIINVVLDPILIFGFGFFPRMELRGAAISNVVSTALAALACLYILTRRKKLVARRHMHSGSLGHSLGKFLAIALPVGLANIIQPAVGTVLTGMLARFGHEGVAAYGIASRIEAFAFIIIMALATGMGPIIGQNWGAGKIDRVMETLKNAFSFVILWSLMISLILALLGKEFLSMFTSEPGVVRDGMLYFWIVSSTYACGNLVHGWASAYNAIGMPQRSFVMIVVRLLVMTLPLAWAGARLWGVEGLFAGIAIANILCGAGFHAMSWRDLKKRQAALQISSI